MTGRRTVLTAALAALSSAVGADAVTGSRAGGEAETISSCTGIDRPGDYVVTTDVGDENARSACLRIRVDDVRLDGRGHVVGGGVAAADGPLEDVTVRNFTAESEVTMVGGVAAARFENVAGGRVSEVRGDAVGNGVAVERCENVRVERSCMRGVQGIDDTSGVGYGVGGSRNVAVVDSRTEGFRTGANLYRSEGVVVRNVSLAGSELVSNSRAVSASDVRRSAVVESRIGYGGAELSGNAAGVTVARNVVTGGVDVSVTGDGDGAANTVANNRFSGSNVDVYRAAVPLRVAGNAFGGITAAVRVADDAVCDADPNASLLTVRRNDFGDAAYGVYNGDDEVVDARRNYWNAADGPSSPGDRTLVDPVTGEPADGRGAAVTEHPDRPGVANVRFDPWLRRPTVRATADGGLSTNVG